MKKNQVSMQFLFGIVMLALSLLSSFNNFTGIWRPNIIVGIQFLLLSLFTYLLNRKDLNVYYYVIIITFCLAGITMLLAEFRHMKGNIIMTYDIGNALPSWPFLLFQIFNTLLLVVIIYFLYRMFKRK